MSAPAPSKEEIVQHFQNLCGQQRQYQGKLAELRQEKGEHELVAATLKDADSSRKAWRLVGGVLTERTVGEILPALEEQIKGLTEIMEKIQTAMNDKAKEITAYREKHQIMVKGMAASGPATGSGQGKSGVLVQ
ncbi:Oidioi.mRNA.OKI2018_I69.chr1.g1662.t1.cds [Oikopleura dioica]|uniref:Oidioi.mRNA.OKI2018_I69.chr1.g1662.t1.cds n=1 Tax=Oikopleura dioica TaxID=34765 RepID=A0ABN7SSU2_OIKDI|nr:Oidioi.mRNA.OKI2018_I69.chr1.g1662.t1.cds [Oikopleura dioica]